MTVSAAFHLQIDDSNDMWEDQEEEEEEEQFQGVKKGGLCWPPELCGAGGRSLIGKGRGNSRPQRVGGRVAYQCLWSSQHLGVSAL